MTRIPLHQLSEQSRLKVEIMRFSNEDAPYVYNEANIERNDHYIFLLFETGKAMLMVDFEEIALTKGSIYYVLPGQVHHRIYEQQAEGWFLAVDSSLVPLEFRNVFEGKPGLQDLLKLNSSLFNQCSSILTMIHDRCDENLYSIFDNKITNTLLQSFMGIVAGGYNQQGIAARQASRPQQLNHRFKALLTENFRSLKSPSAYAEKLHVSENYLNAIIKAETGCPVSYWIINEILMEAKRLLYHSTLDAKEIAHEVGYEDHTYFYKVFKKHEGISPLSFRNKKQ